MDTIYTANHGPTPHTYKSWEHYIYTRTAAKYLEELRALLIVNRDEHGHAGQRAHGRLLRVDLGDVGDAPGQHVGGAVVPVLEAELVRLVSQALDQNPRVSCR